MMRRRDGKMSRALRTWIAFGLVTILGLTLVGEIRAQNPLLVEEKTTAAAWDEWGLSITPYAWFAAQSSDVGGEKLRQSFNDLASITNLGFCSLRL